MPNTYKSDRKGLKALLRDAKRELENGSTPVFYGVEQVSRSVAPYEDAQLAGRWTVTRMDRLGGPMCGSMTLKEVLQRYGPLSDSPPLGVRGVWEPAPQVAGPVDDQPFDRPLDDVEIRGLEKRVRDASEARRLSRRRRI